MSFMFFHDTMDFHTPLNPTMLGHVQFSSISQNDCSHNIEKCWQLSPNSPFPIHFPRFSYSFAMFCLPKTDQNWHFPKWPQVNSAGLGSTWAGPIDLVSAEVSLWEVGGKLAKRWVVWSKSNPKSSQIIVVSCVSILVEVWSTSLTDGWFGRFFSIYWEWSSQLTNSYFSEGWLNHQPVYIQ